jgi:gliding motility-associated-like protein
LTLFSQTVLFAQQPTSGDCLGGFAVCQLTYVQPLSFAGEGNYQGEVNGTSSCLSSGERNNAWYIITVQSSGSFGFNIIPNPPANPADPQADYDFALYNLTNANCSEIATDVSLEVSCNFSGSTFPTAVTGMNNGANPQDENFINVNAGEVYALVVNNFTGNNQLGYTLDLSLSTANIIDNIPPTITAITSQVNCGSNSITFQYSEFVKCETVLSPEFLLIGPDNSSIPITSVTGIACVNNGRFEKEFTILLGEQIYNGGNYQLKGFGRVEDNCGNFIADTQRVIFNIATFSTSTNTTPVDCRTNNGTATVTVTSGGTAPFSYLWEPSGQTSATAVNLPFGPQYVTVTDAQGCFIRDSSANVIDQNNFDVSLVITPDTCSFGKGKARAVVSGGTPFQPPADPYIYFWNVTNQPNDTIEITNLQTGPYQMSVRDSYGCLFNIDFLVPDYRYNLTADFLYSPDTIPIPGLFPRVDFINTSINGDQFLWDFGTGDVSTDFEPSYIFPGSGTYDVKLITINSNGCKDSVFREIIVDFVLTFYAPNAFTPNQDNVNDSFKVIVTGIWDSTFQMTIYNRWGSDVFMTNDKKVGWSGKNRNDGKDCESEVYIYRVGYIDQSGKKHVVYGRVLLLG